MFQREVLRMLLNRSGYMVLSMRRLQRITVSTAKYNGNCETCRFGRKDILQRITVHVPAYLLMPSSQ
jgi:hypothetical protein